MAVNGPMQIEGGNWQIFYKMLEASNATIKLNTSVSSISKSKSKYNVKTTTKDAASGETYTDEEPFDTVVLAAPYQFSDLEIEEGLVKRAPDSIPFVTLHVTLFASPCLLSPLYFNLTPGEVVPTSILTTLPPGEVPTDPESSVGSIGFFSITTLRAVINPETKQKEFLYKIFSPKVVTSSFLSDILGMPGKIVSPVALKLSHN